LIERRMRIAYMDKGIAFLKYKCKTIRQDIISQVGNAGQPE
jgi:hypothetical protein